MDILVSIIIPIYNAENYLEKCISSIVNQTYANLEIILFNDGSTDRSLEICEKYAEKDPRIVVQSQENQGVVKARQAGMRIATGDFIGWSDADDWMEPDYIENLVKVQKVSGADIVAAAHYHDIDQDGDLVKNGLKPGIYEREHLVPEMLYTGRFFEYGINPHLYTKLFKAEILKKIQPMVEAFIVAGDDAAVVYPSLLRAEKVCVTELAGYHYVQHAGSITKTGFGDEGQRVEALIAFLDRLFREAQVDVWTAPQLAAYKKYLLSLRQIEAFDTSGDDKILVPFGGFQKGDKLIIYGAGVLGQKIYRYCKQDGRVELVDWLDKNYENYRNQGFLVNSPNTLVNAAKEYDYILIANITERTAMSIKDFLLSVGVKEEKIKWFSAEFRGEKE